MSPPNVVDRINSPPPTSSTNAAYPRPGQRATSTARVAAMCHSPAAQRARVSPLSATLAAECRGASRQPHVASRTQSATAPGVG